MQHSWKIFLENQAFPNKLVHYKMAQSLLRLYANRCPLTKLIVSRYIARARRDAKMTCQALKIQKVPKQMSHFLNKNLIEYFGNEPYHYAPNKTSKLYIPSTIKHLKEATQHIYLGK